MTKPDAFMQSDALISPCGQYRYWLSRLWAAGGLRLVFVMLNPSTADADVDDPTIRKCIGFAQRAGFDGITVVNLFAWRATDPRELWATRSDVRVGPYNDHFIFEACREQNVVFAWGAHGDSYPDRVLHVERFVRRVAQNVLAIRLLDSGQPAHPLMQPYSLGLSVLP